jgi:hypothetical protein
MVSDGIPIILILLVCVMNRYGRFIPVKSAPGCLTGLNVSPGAGLRNTKIFIEA